MSARFSEALRLVLVQEGGRVDDPRDPGGRTDRGITQATYDAWRHRQALALRSVFAIDPNEVVAIYRHDYAEPLRFDDLPPGVDYAAFDAAVNSGVAQAARWLAAAAGGAPDGGVNLRTISACRKADPNRLIDALCDARLGLMRRLPSWIRFRVGWTRRVIDVRRQAHAMATVTEAPSAPR